MIGGPGQNAAARGFSEELYGWNEEHDVAYRELREPLLPRLLCTKCTLTKPARDFAVCTKAKRRSGRAYWCRECYRDYNAERSEQTASSPDGPPDRSLELTAEALGELIAHGCDECGSHERLRLNQQGGVLRGVVCKACADKLEQEATASDGSRQSPAASGKQPAKRAK